MRLTSHRYLDAAMSRDAVVAYDYQQVHTTTTHLEFHPTVMLGYSAGAIPYADHDCAPRVTFQASMSHQVSCPVGSRSRVGAPDRLAFG